MSIINSLMKNKYPNPDEKKALKFLEKRIDFYLKKLEEEGVNGKICNLIKEFLNIYNCISQKDKKKYNGLYDQYKELVYNSIWAENMSLDPDKEKALKFLKDKIEIYLNNDESCIPIEDFLNIYNCITRRDKDEYKRLYDEYKKIDNASIKVQKKASKNASIKGRKKASENDSIKVQKKVSENASIKILEERNLLEEEIISLIGGKTGMCMTWGEIMKWASLGDVKNFHCFADTFPRKAEYLEMVYNKLKSIIAENKVSGSDKRLSLVSMPYENAEQCEELINNSKFLKDFLANGTISEEDLRKWYEERVRGKKNISNDETI